MATPILVGVGTIAAALVGRQLFRSGVIGAGRAADQWVKGGFKAKMDRKEAIAILGLRYVVTVRLYDLIAELNSLLKGQCHHSYQTEGCSSTNHARKPS